MDDDAPFHNPFGALAHLRGDAEPAPEPRAPAPVPATAHPKVARASVRMERTGRGGKEVTVVDHLDLNATTLEQWLRELKSALGCGGVVEDGAIVLQGDHRTRLPALLASRGVKKVTTSG